MTRSCAPTDSRRIAEIQDAGIEADIWKIEGVDERADAGCSPSRPAPAGATRGLCGLGRGADDAKVDHWLEQAAPWTASLGLRSGARSGGTR